MKHNKWTLASGSSSALPDLLSAGMPMLPAMVFCARGIGAPEAAADFLGCDETALHSSHRMKDMDRAVSRIRRALDTGERIAVFGDYDVDGITSTALLTSYLQEQGGVVISYIPDRLEEGYGLNVPAIRALWAEGVTLLVTVDCGITAVEEVKAAAALGMDVVITDHHECKDTLPQALAIVNPLQPDCPYPFSALAGVGVALKLVLAMGGEANEHALFRRYADLAAIGTVADVMELTDENRVIVQTGLHQLNTNPRPGLKMLLQEAGIEGKQVTSTTIGFTLAPRINASGRMGCAGLACELLLSEDPARSEALARELCALNRERQGIELGIYNECLTRLSREPAGQRCAIVLADERWHQGVVGIVASRLSEKFACPTFMICLSDGKGKGSCRSYGKVNLFQALTACADLLESFGGHELAAGFTILEEHIPAFRQRILAFIRAQLGGRQLEEPLPIDVEITDPALLTLPQVESLDILEPYGNGNPKPAFLLSGVTVVSVSVVGGGRHTKFRVRRDNSFFDAIFFSATPQDAGITPGARLDVAFYPGINEFRGNRTVQLQVLDVRPALTQSQAEQQLYHRYRAGDTLSPQEAALLTPSREDFVAVWRYLQKHSAPSGLEDTALRLSRKIARTYGTRETYTRTMVCLEVMDERGLISLCTDTDHLQIRLRPVGRKVNLEDSSIMQRLRRLMGE